MQYVMYSNKSTIIKMYQAGQDSNMSTFHSSPHLLPPPPKLVHLLLYSQSQIIHFLLHFLPAAHNLTFVTFQVLTLKII